MTEVEVKLPEENKEKTRHFKNISNGLHGENTYDYTKVAILKNYKEKVEIIHNLCGNSFIQRAQYHMDGGGCGYCSGRLESTDSFLKKLKSIYGENKYDFSKVSYKGTYDEVELKCLSCNTYFTKKPTYLVNNVDVIHCPTCSLNGKQQGRRVCTEEDFSLNSLDYFIKRGNQVHKEIYSYAEIKEYPKNNKAKVPIICKTHGLFKQRIDDHLRGKGCPSCQPKRSKAEIEIVDFLKGLGEEVLISQRILGRKEIDIYIPRLNIGIEYDGLYTHSKLHKNYHIDKTNEAKAIGIRLIHVFEDEWIHKENIVKNRLSSILGKSAKRTYARNLKIHALDFQETKLFLENTHIQGSGSPAAYRYGLKNSEGSLLAVMTFSKSRFRKEENRFELIRFSSEGNVVGGFSKLLTYFIKEVNPIGIITYADKRWSEGGVYEKNGFKKKEDTEVGYFWCKGQKRYNRVNFQKHKLKEMFENYSPDMTEEELCKLNGFTKIYDCGQLVFEMDL